MTVRPVHRQLVNELKFRAELPGSCWLVSTPSEAALIVPTLHGGHEHLRTFRRDTIQEALTQGLIGLTRDREPMPAFTSRKPDPWCLLAEAVGLRIWARGGAQ